LGVSHPLLTRISAQLIAPSRRRRGFGPRNAIVTRADSGPWLVVLEPVEKPLHQLGIDRVCLGPGLTFRCLLAPVPGKRVKLAHGRPRPVRSAAACQMTVTTKCLGQSSKSPAEDRATNKRSPRLASATNFTPSRSEGAVMTKSMPHEGTARRAAKRAGLRAVKRRWHRNTSDNRGGFQLLDPMSNAIVAGAKFELSPAAVIEICERRTDSPR
jgi:hypothetical protein